MLFFQSITFRQITQNMAAALSSTASAGLRASTSSVVCRCSMTAAKASNRQQQRQRTFSTSAPSSSSSILGERSSIQSRKLGKDSHATKLQGSQSDTGKAARNQVSHFSRVIWVGRQFAGSLIGRCFHMYDRRGSSKYGSSMLLIGL